MKTIITICCFHFHIKWNGNLGEDQNGHIWLNPQNPVLEDQSLYDFYLDAYNDMTKRVAELKKRKLPV